MPNWHKAMPGELLEIAFKMEGRDDKCCGALTKFRTRNGYMVNENVNNDP